MCRQVKEKTVRLHCSRIFPDKEKMVNTAIEIAAGIAEKSPIAVQGTKANLVYARDHSVSEGLEYAVSKQCDSGYCSDQAI